MTRNGYPFNIYFCECKSVKGALVPSSTVYLVGPTYIQILFFVLQRKQLIKEKRKNENLGRFDELLGNPETWSSLSMKLEKILLLIALWIIFKVTKTQ